MFSVIKYLFVSFFRLFFPQKEKIELHKWYTKDKKPVENSFICIYTQNKGYRVANYETFGKNHQTPEVFVWDFEDRDKPGDQIYWCYLVYPKEVNNG